MAIVYRVVRQKYTDRPMDVTGTWLNGGRWNPPGVGILYTTEHPALALVEILVHMPQVPYDELPAYRLFSLELPQDSQRVVDAVGLPPYWQENTYNRSQYLVADWLARPDVLALGVPSSVMSSGINYLLHLAHSSYGSIRVIDEKPLVIDPRLWSK
jgi:RES domain-containing protein